MVTATWTAARMAQRHTAQRLSPHLPIFERLCYIKKQYERTMAFITPNTRRSGRVGELEGRATCTKQTRRKNSGDLYV